MYALKAGCCNLKINQLEPTFCIPKRKRFLRWEGRKEEYTSLQPPRADWMDWQHPNNQNNP
jgi:hypothetical protein